jgi:dipeptidyl aminopeptidase/acylaminoacyl peptidase
MFPLLFILAAGPVEQVPLLPRALFFSPPDVTTTRLSPDGKQVGWRAPDGKGVTQLWVQPLPVGQATQVTSGGDRPVLDFAWAEDGATLLVQQEVDGDGLTHLFAVELASKAVRDLTPWKGVRARLLGTSQKVADQMLVLVNQRDPKAFDVHRINLKTGSSELDTKNPGDVVAFAHDEALVVRAALARLPDAGSEVRVRDTVRLPWRSLVRASAQETLGLLGVALDGKGVYLTTSVATDTARVVEKNLKTGTERVLAASPSSDLREWIWNPWKFAVQAAAFEEKGRLVWSPIEFSVFRDVELLTAAAAPGVFRVLSRDRSDNLWLVEVDADRTGRKTMLWDRASKKGTVLFAEQPRLDGVRLAEQKAVTIPARDGTALPALLTTPAQAGGGKLPLVLLVRGAPQEVERWGYDARAQFLANRGYAALQVNFRGTAGFGKRLLNLGNREWGKRMQDDLTDAVAWAVKEANVDPRRVAIAGNGYGGYAALMGLVSTPEVYRCGAAGFGPVDLTAWAKAAAPAIKALEADWKRRVADPDLVPEQARLEVASPTSYVDRLQAPVLLAFDADDPQLKSAQALVGRLDKSGGAYTLLQYSNAERTENTLDYYARLETFLAGCLGGRAEPMPKSSTAQVMQSTRTIAPAKR